MADVLDRPTGTATFLFTDIEGSTRLWDEHPEVMKVALARHDEMLPRRRLVTITGNSPASRWFASSAPTCRAWRSTPLCSTRCGPT